MDPSEPLAIYRSGGLTRAECALWVAWYPDEPPLVNGELEWISLTLADLERETLIASALGYRSTDPVRAPGALAGPAALASPSTITFIAAELSR